MKLHYSNNVTLEITPETPSSPSIEEWPSYSRTSDTFLTPIKSVFIAGPTPRSHIRLPNGDPVPSWRPQLIRELGRAGFNGDVYIPEYSTGMSCSGYHDQVDWEYEHLAKASVVAFWIPRDLKLLPGFTTNTEFGYWINHQSILYGRPENTPKTRYLDWMYRKVTNKEPVDSMQKLALSIVDALK